MAIYGLIETADCNKITGWVGDSASAPGSFNGGLFIDGNGPIASFSASAARPDVAANYKGILDHPLGFSVPTPPGLLDGKSHSISAKEMGSGNVITNGLPGLFGPCGAGSSYNGQWAGLPGQNQYYQSQQPPPTTGTATGSSATIPGTSAPSSGNLPAASGSLLSSDLISGIPNTYLFIGAAALVAGFMFLGKK